jgi:predicted DNA-binding protein (MmcQ/YjbR family)
MRYTWLDEFLLAKKAVNKDYKEEWGWHRYMISDKLFAAVCCNGDGEPVYLTLKLDPLEGEFWRKQYEDIIPGYYMNKIHWNSIKVDGEVPDDLVKELLDKSYSLILGGFSKKKQAELLKD